MTRHRPSALICARVRAALHPPTKAARCCGRAGCGPTPPRDLYWHRPRLGGAALRGCPDRARCGPRRPPGRRGLNAVSGNLCTNDRPRPGKAEALTLSDAHIEPGRPRGRLARGNAGIFRRSRLDRLIKRGRNAWRALFRPGDGANVSGHNRAIAGARSGGCGRILCRWRSGWTGRRGKRVRHGKACACGCRQHPNRHYQPGPCRHHHSRNADWPSRVIGVNI